MSHQIELNAEQIAIMAEGLNARIEEFQNYLGALKGKTHAVLVNDETDEKRLVLRFHRKSDSWIISCRLDDEEEKPLVHSSVKVKCRSISLFPQLLEQVLSAQNNIIEDMRKAGKVYDEFFNRLKVVKQ